jgi:ADP-ribose pyrophosphatase
MQPQFTKISSAEAFRCRIFNVLKDSIRLASGRVTERFTVVHPGAVVILPLTSEGKLMMIRQYRHSIAKTILEAPAGTLEEGEHPEDCAKREIMEEVGMQAEKWTPLGVLYPAPGFCTELQHLYLAEELTPGRLPQDEDEIIEVVEMTPEEVMLSAAQGEIVDAKTISIFARARFLELI